MSTPAIKRCTPRQAARLLKEIGLNAITDPLLITDKFFGATVTKSPDGAGLLRFVISTGDVDRDQDRINPDGWKLDNFRKNPVMLWAHSSYDPPIAKCAKAFVDEMKRLIVDAEFTPQDLYPFGYMIGKMYEQGYLNAQSVGLRAIKATAAVEPDRPWGIDYQEQELIETSALPCPSNPDALYEARQKGIDTTPLFEWCGKHLDLRTPFMGRDYLEAVRKASDPASTVSVAMPEITDDAGAELFQVEAPAGADATDADATATADVETPTPESPNSETPGDTTAEPGAPTDAPVAPPNAASAGATEGKGASVLVLDIANMGIESIDYAAAHATVTKSGLDVPWVVWKGWPVEENATCIKSAKQTDECSLLAHHEPGEGNPVNWEGVKAAMLHLISKSALPLTMIATVYEHLAKHYEDFGQTAPVKAFAFSQILKHFPDNYRWDSEKGIVIALTSQEAARTIAAKTLDGAIKALNQEDPEIFKQAGVSEKVAQVLTLLTTIKSGVIDGSGGGESDAVSDTFQVADAPVETGFSVDMEALGEAITEQTQKAVRKAMGKVD